MFSLIHGLWKYFWRKDEYCILLLGLDNAGKSTFLEKTRSRFDKSYAARNLNRITSTVGLNVGSIETQGVRILFWDLGGQGDLQLLWDKVSLNPGFQVSLFTTPFVVFMCSIIVSPTD